MYRRGNFDDFQLSGLIRFSRVGRVVQFAECLFGRFAWMDFD